MHRWPKRKFFFLSMNHKMKKILNVITIVEAKDLTLLLSSEIEDACSDKISFWGQKKLARKTSSFH